MARKTYKVKKGDSYFKIAERLWGNQLFAGQLIKANPGRTCGSSWRLLGKRHRECNDQK